jgi:four helix bundle protein
MEKIKNFSDLIAWQEGHKFIVSVYHYTKKFPTEERFGLTVQLRRSAISLTSNIAEGFSRFSRKEKNQFYSIALGSLAEAFNQLLIARDVGYLSMEEFKIFENKILFIRKLILGLIKSSRKYLP